MNIYLARHGATEWSQAGRHTGRTNLPLLPLGESQARALRSVLAGRSFAHVFSSPLQRALTTAQLAGFGDRAQATDDLYEVDYGQDEGRTREQIQTERPGWDFFQHGPQGGETLAEVATRTRRFLDTLPATGDNVLLFAHGHVLRILTATYLGEAPSWGGHLALGTASVSVLGQQNGVPAILHWNDESHLAGFESTAR